MHKLLVSGYVQEVEHSLESEKIIPTILHHIIYQYYFTLERSKLFYLNTDFREPNGLYITNINKRQKWECRLFHNNKLTDFSKIDDISKWNMRNCGLTYTEHLILPNNFISEHLEKYVDNETYHQYNAIFKCGGASTTSFYAIIINEQQFQDGHNKLSMYRIYYIYIIIIIYYFILRFIG